jgi:hypothetical protein
MDKSDLYCIYMLLWIILARVSSDLYGSIIAGVIAVVYGCAAIYQDRKESKNK